MVSQLEERLARRMLKAREQEVEDLQRHARELEIAYKALRAENETLRARMASEENSVSRRVNRAVRTFFDRFGTQRSLKDGNEAQYVREVQRG